ncbi:MAG: hypothetical protein PHO79_01750 [Desulfoplanes sp.]|nr:hypothetical protein [Desulfoplanes sp.]MDD4648733.1 hypothetical protein [Desulfoplanes sp.]
MNKINSPSSNDEQMRTSNPEIAIANRKRTNREQLIAGLKMAVIASIFLLAIWLLER